MGLLGQLDSMYDGGCGRERRCEASMSFAFSSLMSASKKKKKKEEECIQRMGHGAHAFVDSQIPSYQLEKRGAIRAISRRRVKEGARGDG